MSGLIPTRWQPAHSAKRHAAVGHTAPVKVQRAGGTPTVRGFREAALTRDVVDFPIHHGEVGDLQPQQAGFGPEVTLLGRVQPATLSAVAGTEGVSVHLKPPAERAGISDPSAPPPPAQLWDPAGMPAPCHRGFETYLCFPWHLLHIMVFMASFRSSCSRLRNSLMDLVSSLSAIRLLGGGERGSAPAPPNPPCSPTLPTHISYSFLLSGLLTMSQAARSTLNAASALGCSFLSGWTWKKRKSSASAMSRGSGGGTDTPCPPTYQHRQPAIGFLQLGVRRRCLHAQHLEGVQLLLGHLRHGQQAAHLLRAAGGRSPPIANGRRVPRPPCLTPPGRPGGSSPSLQPVPEVPARPALPEEPPRPTEHGCVQKREEPGHPLAPAQPIRAGDQRAGAHAPAEPQAAQEQHEEEDEERAEHPEQAEEEPRAGP